MSIYDWFLLGGVLYTAIGSDLLLNWGAGLITGKRLRGDSPNPLERLYYWVHARNDPNMRADPPVEGPVEKVAPWEHALAVGNGTIVLVLEALVVYGLLVAGSGGPVPDAARLAAFAWLMRSIWGELSYWHILTASEIEPLRGWRLGWYWVIGMPQAFFPFLVAERFYQVNAPYSFEPLRFAAFLAVPLVFMVLLKVTYRGRVW